VTDTPHVRPQTTVGARVRRSFDQSVGSIVFGMEDGTVSIFGLVFGVAASAPDSKAVLLAGATGAAAAAVSMMAGAFLDAESANDQNAAKLEDLRRRLDHESSMKDEAARAP
jgi:VIT1/CCC1 family predicted Fe2+/Mn2+ transporter